MGIPRLLVGQIGGSRRVNRQVIALAALIRIDFYGEQGTGQSDPCLCVLGLRVLDAGNGRSCICTRGCARVICQGALASGSQLGGILPGSLPVFSQIFFISLRIPLDALVREGSLLCTCVYDGNDEAKSEESLCEKSHGWHLRGLCRN